jgi:hypothetical protein
VSRRFAGINIDSVPALPVAAGKDQRADADHLGADDCSTPCSAEHAARNIPGAKLIVYETGGHLLVGRQQQVRDAVRAFLVAAGLATPAHAKQSAF